MSESRKASVWAQPNFTTTFDSEEDEANENVRLYGVLANQSFTSSFNYIDDCHSITRIMARTALERCLTWNLQNLTKDCQDNRVSKISTVEQQSRVYVLDRFFSVNHSAGIDRGSILMTNLGQRTEERRKQLFLQWQRAQEVQRISQSTFIPARFSGPSSATKFTSTPSHRSLPTRIESFAIFQAGSRRYLTCSRRGKSGIDIIDPINADEPSTRSIQST